MEKNKKQRMGIKNLRNTCFMNCVFQCLLTIEDLRNFFKKTKKAEDGLLFDMFKDFIENSENTENILEPRELIRLCFQLFPGTQAYTQQDAQEFFLLLVQELSKVLVDRQEEDIFNKLFYWKLLYRIRCKDSGEKTFEEVTFQLRLPINKIPPKVFDWRSPDEESFLNTKVSSMFCKIFRDKNPLTINDCIKNFFMNYEETELECCQYCGKSGCHQIIEVLDSPKYIIFHLERLEVRRKIVKINKTVYPLLSIIIGKTGQKYKLISSIEHRSYLGRSHYFVYCLDGKDWLKCDDSDIIRVSEEKVINSQPYLLVYEKVPDSHSKKEIIEEEKPEFKQLNLNNFSDKLINKSNVPSIIDSSVENYSHHLAQFNSTESLKVFNNYPISETNSDRFSISRNPDERRRRSQIIPFPSISMELPSKDS